MDKKTDFKTGILFGAVLGGLAAFFLAPKSGKENREMAKKTFSQLKKMMEDKSIDEIVTEIYGKASDEGKKLYVKARKDLDKRLDEMNNTLGEIDKKKYMLLVDDVIEHVQGEAEATKDRVAKLQEYLMKRWDRVQTMAQKDATMVVEDVEDKVVKNK